MAGIDKMFLNWNNYVEFKKWCEAQPLLVDKYGRKERITEYLYEYDEPFDKEIPVFKAPCYVDAYVIRNCPLKAMQDEMKFHYQTSYDDIKSGKLYNKPTTSMPYFIGRHFKIVKHPGKKTNHSTLAKFWVNVSLPKEYENMMEYNEDTRTWDFVDEYVISDTASSIAHVNTIKAVKRLIRTWRLPIGACVTVIGCYVGEDWEFVVKL